MSLILMHGFEESQTITDYSPAGGGSIITSIARTGSNSMTTSTAGINPFSIPTSQEHATIIVGFALYKRAMAGTTEIRFLSDAAATTHITVTIRTDGSIDVRRGTNSGTLLGSALPTGTITITTWTHMVIKVKLDDAVGTVDIWINGANVYSFSGDTKNAGTKTVLDTITFFDNGGVSLTALWDDLYILNGDATAPNDNLGDKKVVTLMPNAEGTTQDFTPTPAGTHYTTVDEKPRNTTDYVSAATSGNLELFAMENLPAGSQNISAIQIEYYANKSDAGSTCYFQRAVRSASNNYFGNAIALGTSFTYLKEAGSVYIILPTDPATSSAWTTSAVDALEVGARFDI